MVSAIFQGLHFEAAFLPPVLILVASRSYSFQTRKALFPHRKVANRWYPTCPSKTFSRQRKSHLKASSLGSKHHHAGNHSRSPSVTIHLRFMPSGFTTPRSTM